MRTDSPRMIGAKRISRRTTKRSTVRSLSAGCYIGFLDAAEEDGGEWIATGRARDVALHGLLEPERRARVRVRDTREDVLHDHVVRRLVDLDALGEVDLA